jgi:hypothetical protein
VSARIAFILHAAMVYVASRVRQAVPGQGPAIIPVRFERLINLWLEARKRAIVALIGRIEAGTQSPPQPYKPRETKAAAEPGTARTIPGVRLPTRFGWLCVIGREVSGPSGWLATLLGETELKEMITAHPQLARLIRPVLRMLGQLPPEWFPKAAKRAGADAKADRARRRTPPAGDARADATSRELSWFIAAEAARQYAQNMAVLYEGCGGPPPAVAKQIARLAEKAAPPTPAPTPVAALPRAEVPLDRDKYYYAETWNGKLIPVRRRWG